MVNHTPNCIAHMMGYDEQAWHEITECAQLNMEVVTENTSLKKSQNFALAMSRRQVLTALGVTAVGAVLAHGARPSLGYAQPPHLPGLDISYIDPSIRPQDDVYRYMNGKWIDSFQLPADKACVSSFVELEELNLARLHKLITHLEPHTDEESKLKTLYHSVMNTPALDRGGLKNISRQWAMIDAVTTKDDLCFVVGQLAHSYIFSFPVALGVEIDAKDSSRYVYGLGSGGLGLTRRFLLEEHYRSRRVQYQDFLISIAREARLPEPEQLAQQVVNFEIAIAQGLWTEEQQRDPVKTYNSSSLSGLKRSYPHFNWDKYVQGVGIPTIFLDRIIVDMPSFYKHFDVLWEQTSLAHLRSWIKLSVLRQTLGFLPKKFRDARFDFYSRKLNGILQRPPRWKTAIAVLDTCMGEALGKLYVARYFPPEAKSYMQGLVKNIIGTYRQRLEQSWLSPATKQVAIAKLAAINISKIGYPDHWEDYSELVMDKDYFDNYRKAAIWRFNLDLRRFPFPVDKTLWGMTPQEVNAYYAFSNNEIVFPAGILQPPFFNHTADPAVNYGGIGAIIGHEISHAFDDQGSQYDVQGNMRDWWTPEDRHKFTQLTHRLAVQYNAFVPRGLSPQDHINGPISVGENAADLNGLTAAARAYRGTKNNGNINGSIDKSLLQALFLNWSRIYREKWRTQALITYLPTAVHSPGEARARQCVKNIDDFAYAFDTHPGDGEYLSPAERIHIW